MEQKKEEQKKKPQKMHKKKGKGAEDSDSGSENESMSNYHIIYHCSILFPDGETPRLNNKRKSKKLRNAKKNLEKKAIRQEDDGFNTVFSVVCFYYYHLFFRKPMYQLPRKRRYSSQKSENAPLLEQELK